MRILCLIPARGGSKGIPGKNIRPLNGKPLLAYTAEVALKCKLFSDVIISTDDHAIADVAQSCGISVPFMRPRELAEDATPTIDVLVHALDFFRQKQIFYDAVCLLQVTSPFRKVEFVNDAVRKFIASGADSLISVRRVPHEFNPHWTFIENNDGNLKIATGEQEIISRRQDLPDAFHRDGSIYITKSAVIEQQKSLYGNTISYIESPVGMHVNIDTNEDWEKAEQLAQNWFINPENS